MTEYVGPFGFIESKLCFSLGNGNPILIIIKYNIIQGHFTLRNSVNERCPVAKINLFAF